MTIDELPNGVVADKKSKPRKKTAKAAGSRRGPRVGAPFPGVTYQEALVVANAIQEIGSGQKVRRITLFDHLNKSPESSASRMMIVNSGRYGLTVGGYKAEHIELTETGSTATNLEIAPATRLRAGFALAIEHVAPFKHLYELYKDKRVPSPQVMRDSLEEAQVAVDMRPACVDIFLENAKYLTLLRTIAGAERLVSLEQACESLPAAGPAGLKSTLPVPTRSEAPQSQRQWERVCFVIAPIGEDGTEERKHSDMFLQSLIERALEGDDLDVVRADKISAPGMITGQVIEYLLHSGLVIADLSFHNPNVFYELAIRHLVGLPTVHLIRAQEQIPFDLKDFRTIVIDTSDKYDLIAKLETYRSEIANAVRGAAKLGAGISPITTFAPGLKVEMPTAPALPATSSKSSNG